MLYQFTLALLKPTVLQSQYSISEILKTIKRDGLQVIQSRRLFWHPDEARKFYAVHQQQFFYERLVAHASSGPLLALLLGGDDAIMRWRQLIGPAKAYKAMWEQPETLRARYAISDTRNAFHGSGNEVDARREIGLVFQGLDLDWLLEQHAKGR